jgi:hypothetical protein
MTQQDTIDRFACNHGRISVSHSFTKDGPVRITLPDHVEFLISPEGVATEIGVNHSIDWSQ